MRRPLIAGYLFLFYTISAASEIYISPFFPLLREDLGLVVAHQATLLATLTICIAVGTVAGGALGYRLGERRILRLGAAALGVGSVVTAGAGSYPILLLGQSLAGLGAGLFWAPGFATFGRMYTKNRGRAIAVYGLAYSLGTSIATFLAAIQGIQWRAVFVVTAVLALGLMFLVPALGDDLAAEKPPPMLRSLKGYLINPHYQLALVAACVAGWTAFVHIGFFPVLFVERGLSLSLVASLVGVGRIASLASKLIGGWLFDRLGGLRSAQLIMAATGLGGIPVLMLPPETGVFLIPVFIGISTTLFPIANALSVTGLPERSSWGLGVYRSFLVGFSAVVSAIFAALLTFLELLTVMYGALAIPLACVGVAYWVRARHPELDSQG